MSNLKKIKKIRWVDSNHSPHQMSEDELLEPVEIISVGFLVKETKDYVVLARELIEDDYRGVIAIPKVCIL